MNVQRVFGAGLVSSAVALSALTLGSCKNSYAPENEPKLEDVDSLNLTKVNKPVIGKDYILYRGLDGKVNQVKNNQYTLPLYESIAKYSTKKCPDILDPESFYIDVQKEIQKVPNDPGTPYQTQSIEKNRISIFFDNLFKLFTALESEEGSNITVREYTMMMDAFSKVANNK